MDSAYKKVFYAIKKMRRQGCILTDVNDNELVKSSNIIKYDNVLKLCLTIFNLIGSLNNSHNDYKCTQIYRCICIKKQNNNIINISAVIINIFESNIK